MARVKGQAREDEGNFGNMVNGPSFSLASYVSSAEALDDYEGSELGDILGRWEDKYQDTRDDNSQNAEKSFQGGK
ncbi:uncharacterized protein N7477_001182 [Penicillium maclennaniae]|uniref:uncharacterized protein n=1 Tax=Penicillium maclennaniae TaxID=1343394 RepID=UPI002541E08E|nr:uncharacterized protein N7477_001182 [Penicillium maclennaniae]KAJ5684837.1 hypothetical protein N7477_001182 [Penicillium maclennaniae]